MAVADRSAVARESLDQKAAKGQQSANNETIGIQLPENAGELHSVWITVSNGECGGRTGSKFRANPAEADNQEGRLNYFEIGGFGYSLSPGL